MLNTPSALPQIWDARAEKHREFAKEEMKMSCIVSHSEEIK